MTKFTRQNAYSEYASNILNEKMKLLAEHGSAEGKAIAAKEAKYKCTGEMQISAAVVYTSLRINDIDFESGGSLKFDGSGWGIGLGATGNTTVSGSFSVSPSELKSMKEVKFQVFFLTGGIGGVEISFWDKNYNPIGVMAGGSLGLGGGSFGGDGKFKDA